MSCDARDRGVTRHVTWLALLDSGLLMVALAFTPPLNPPQCPDYATRMPDGSYCIIGANMGAGLLWLAGILLLLAGTLGLVGSLVTAWWERRLPPRDCRSSIVQACRYVGPFLVGAQSALTGRYRPHGEDRPRFTRCPSEAGARREVDHLDVKPSTAVRHLVEMATVADARLPLRDSELGWPLEELWVGGDLLEHRSDLEAEAWCLSLISCGADVVQRTYPQPTTPYTPSDLHVCGGR